MKERSKRNQEIKLITQELFTKLGKQYKEVIDDQQASHESETTEEGEINQKLNRILKILEQIQSDPSKDPVPEEKFTQNLWEDVFNKGDKETVEMYLI